MTTWFRLNTLCPRKHLFLTWIYFSGIQILVIQFIRNPSLLVKCSHIFLLYLLCCVQQLAFPLDPECLRRHGFAAKQRTLSSTCHCLEVRNTSTPVCYALVERVWILTAWARQLQKEVVITNSRSPASSICQKLLDYVLSSSSHAHSHDSSCTVAIYLNYLLSSTIWSSLRSTHVR